MADPPEKRRYSRVTWDHPARLSLGQAELSGPVLDISLNGVLIGVAPAANAEDPCQVRIPLAGEHGPEINAHGHLARVGADQVAVRFETMDLDSAANLRRVVTLNSPDPAQAEREAVHLRLGDDAPGGP
ncbi:MAG TPA: PilZ domain-containing protein [Gammaproteobacteria bacterium]|nr:PilZ domain-containing protein [Gammaproteobacteria bacterium]